MTETGKKAVLIIEDSKSFANTLASMIYSESFFDVIIAECYAEAEALLAERAEDFFIATVDLHLPDAEDGAAVTLVKSYDIPCIAFTGSFSSALREDIIAMGVCDYVLKTGAHDLAYVARLVSRIYNNPSTKVLVVDDSESAREVLSAQLALQRLNVMVADSGEEALRILNEHKDIRLVMLDLIMENVDGLAVLKHIRMKKDTTEVSVIGVSGVASDDHLAKFLKLGGNDFIRKPYNLEQLFCRINSQLRMLDDFQRLRDLDEQKKRMMGMAAHDLRGPIGAIMTGVSLARRRSEDPKVIQLLEAAEKGCKQQLELLNSLLDLSVIEQADISFKIGPMDLQEVAQDVVEESELWLQAKLQTISLNAEPGDYRVQGDPIRLREVLSNLVTNAAKYSFAGSKIGVSLRANEEGVFIAVHDEGEGVPEDEQPLLFKAFSKLSPQPTGGEHSCGLGLAICKKIVEHHFGQIRYRLDRATDSKKDSVFEFFIPRSGKSNAQQPQW